MRKIYLLCLILFAFTSFTMAQTIENFESVKMNHFSAGTNGSVGVVSNPDPSGINTSANVGQLTRNADGDPWAGWYATLPIPLDVTANKYVHVKIYKTRISPVCFKYERTGGDSGDVFSINPQAKTYEWEELVFNMSKVSGNYVKIVFIPDFETPLTITDEVTIYFDDLYVNNDPEVGSDPVAVMEDYENITLNPMVKDDTDKSSFSLVPNPNKTDLNASDYVIEYLRAKNGIPWGGFWSALPTPIDLTVNKYLHVKVWKSRISPLKFKIEGGAAGNLEIASMSPQTKLGEWEDIVFDFSSKTGTYPTIAFMPDFQDPLTLTEDITIYFDDIVLNNVASSVVTPPEQIVSIDMNGSGMDIGAKVWISGTLGGTRGSWAGPGTIAQNEMLDPDEDGIYSITLSLPDGGYEYKFFWGIGWDNGDNGPGNRAFTVVGNSSVLYEWGVAGFTDVTSAQQLSGVSFKVFPNPVTNLLTIQSPEMKGIVVSDLLGRTLKNYQFQAVNSQQIDISDLQSGVYLITVKTSNGINTSKFIKQ